MRTTRTLASLLLLILTACGGAPVGQSLRSANASERAAIVLALRAAHGPDARVLEARAIGSPERVVVVYARTDAASPTDAASRMCGGTAVGDIDLVTCTGVGIGLARLAADGNTLDGDLALGCSDDSRVSIGIEAGDLDGDAHAELAITVAQRATYVLDVERFGVQLAAWGTAFVFEHPRGTGLQTPFCRMEEETLMGPRRATSAWAEPPSESFDFDDLPDGCEIFVAPYDPVGDCWRVGLR